MADSPTGAARWRAFLAEVDAIVAGDPAEGDALDWGEAALVRLIVADDWLPDAFAADDPARYQQHLLHRDPAARYSVVSFVWGPGQATPIHDHTVWGLVGMLRGCESSQRFVPAADGQLHPAGEPRVLRPGDVERLSPTEGDIHQVTNARDAVSISIHLYGADIGAVRRHSFRPDGSVGSFVSGYSASTPPVGWEGNLT